MDDDEIMIASDEQIIAQEEIFVQNEIMDPEMEEFIEDILQEDDVICCLCEGCGMDFFGGECTLCDGFGKLLDYGDGDHNHDDAVNAVGDKKPERRVEKVGDWQKIRTTLDSGSTVDVMPADELCQVDTVPCTGSRANRSMFAANGTIIDSKGEKKFKAVTDDGFPLDSAFISGAVKKILKSTAITCDEGGDKGQWVIPTKSGGWIVNVETKRKIPFYRVGNTYFMDAWVRVPQKAKDKG